MVMDGADCLGSDMDAGVLHFNWSGFEPIQGILGTDHGLDCAQYSYMQLFWFLLDPSPIIGYACHELTNWLTH